MNVQQNLKTSSYLQHLKQMIDVHPELVLRLQYLRELNPQAYLSAGVIRNMVWSILHRQTYTIENTEIDVIFYNAFDIHNEEQRLTQLLSQKFPENTWDVVNQAFVHRWYTIDDGKPISQYLSLIEALSFWPETATAIAVRLTENNDIEILAPLGLEDLFELKVRWNNRLVSHQVFLERVQAKRFLERWEKLEIIPLTFEK